MVINKKKSGVIVHNRRDIGKLIAAGKTYKDIPLVKKYKYLGVQLDGNLTMMEHMEYIKEKIKKAQKMLLILKL